MVITLGLLSHLTDEEIEVQQWAGTCPRSPGKWLGTSDRNLGFPSAKLICVSAFLAFEREVSILGVKSSVFGEPPGFGGGEPAHRNTRGRGLEASDLSLGEVGWQVGRKEELVVGGGNFEGLFF